MKILHISDLHLGRRLNDVSLLDDQKAVLSQILDVVQTEKPDVVLIAGDVYDRANPQGEAMRVFGTFLTDLRDLETRVVVISGNHDDPERIAYASALIARTGVYMAPAFRGIPAPLHVEDEFGPVHIYPLPYLTPALVRERLAVDEATTPCRTMPEAMELVLARMNPDTSIRNVLVAHQTVTGADPAGSESVAVGGSDAISPAIFAAFDYVALGHFHKSQSQLGGRVHYSGSVLKYSFNELNQSKSVTIAEIGPKGTLPVLRMVPLVPVHDLRELRGSYDELMAASFAERQHTEDYLRIILTDEMMEPNVLCKLSSRYPNIMECRYDNLATRSAASASDLPPDLEELAPLDLVSAFFKRQTAQEMTADQAALLKRHIRELW